MAWASPLDVENWCTWTNRIHIYNIYALARDQRSCECIRHRLKSFHVQSDCVSSVLVLLLFHLIRIDRSALGICHTTYVAGKFVRIEAQCIHDDIVPWFSLCLALPHIISFYAHPITTIEESPKIRTKTFCIVCVVTISEVNRLVVFII